MSVNVKAVDILAVTAGEAVAILVEGVAAAWWDGWRQYGGMGWSMVCSCEGVVTW